MWKVIGLGTAATVALLSATNYVCAQEYSPTIRGSLDSARENSATTNATSVSDALCSSSQFGCPSEGAAQDVLRVSSALTPVSATDLTAYSAGRSSSWLTQIGVTGTIETEAHFGKGVTIAFVDTGAQPLQLDITGRVSSLSACTAVSFTCSNTYHDDNGHGTAVAAIAAAAPNSNLSVQMEGVAANATILAGKSLNATGSGTASDVANGITKMVDAGANVINLSLTFIPTTSTINAINYAASKGVYIVYAAGNSATPLLNGTNTTGLTTAALSHLLITGSVNSYNVLSTFSNTPGTGKLVAGTTSSPYAAHWLMAPGEKIVAPAIQWGINAFGYWTGTSMAAPMVSGALALLEATWPILKTNGTAASLLLNTATDLGPVGMDTQYGMGLLNVSKAFQYTGTLSMTTTSGSTVSVTSASATTVTSGALGALRILRPVLSHYTVFDSYQRNFTVDLSGLLASVNPKASASNVGTATVMGGTMSLGKGAALSFARTDDEGLTNSMIGAEGHGFMSVAASDLAHQQSGWVFSLSEANGLRGMVGRGFPASAAIAQTLMGRNDDAVSTVPGLFGPTSLLSLADGGQFLAFSPALAPKTRVEVSWSSSYVPNGNSMFAHELTPHASAMSIGVSSELTEGWTGSVTVTSLREHNGLLGAQYTSGLLALGDQHNSSSIDVSSVVNLGGGRELVGDALLARTSGDAVKGGLIDHVSDLFSRAISASFLQHDAFLEGDTLRFSVAKPLRVFSGSIGVMTAGVDALGLATSGVARVNAAPGGDETDMMLGYSDRASDSLSVSGLVGARLDSGNVQGATSLVAELHASLHL